MRHPKKCQCAPCASNRFTKYSRRVRQASRGGAGSLTEAALSMKVIPVKAYFRRPPGVASVKTLHYFIKADPAFRRMMMHAATGLLRLARGG
jgi:hypothetical protein